jgi:hypothetical protein
LPLLETVAKGFIVQFSVGDRSRSSVCAIARSAYRSTP